MALESAMLPTPRKAAVVSRLRRARRRAMHARAASGAVNGAFLRAQRAALNRRLRSLAGARLRSQLLSLLLEAPTLSAFSPPASSSLPAGSSWWPPNCCRIAESTWLAKWSSSREAKRSKSDAASTGAGTPMSTAALTVQRPSPESDTRPARPSRSGWLAARPPSDRAAMRRSPIRGARVRRPWRC